MVSSRRTKYNEPNKEENMETNSEQMLILMPKGYEFSEVNDRGILITKKQPKYPKNYKECCEVLGLNTMDNDAQGYKGDLIIGFQELLIARDAYWKIAGEQMGLKEPWKPVWDWREYKFCIGTIYDKIEKFHVGPQNMILAFPTEEIRDTFYENFKDLIETCKQFL